MKTIAIVMLAMFLGAAGVQAQTVKKAGFRKVNPVAVVGTPQKKADASKTPQTKPATITVGGRGNNITLDKADRKKVTK